MRKLLIAFTLLASTPLCWQPLRGQSPSVGKEAGSKKKNIPASSPNKATDNQRGTKYSPLVVDTEGHQETPAEAEEKAREKEGKHNVDTWTLRWAGVTAGATVILMFVGIGGVCAALRTLWMLERQVGIMVNSERAWVMISTVHPTEISPVGPGQMQPFNEFRFNISNRGKTVARLKEFQFCYSYRPGTGDEPRWMLNGHPDYNTHT